MFLTLKFEKNYSQGHARSRSIIEDQKFRKKRTNFDLIFFYFESFRDINAVHLDVPKLGM